MLRSFVAKRIAPIYKEPSQASELVDEGLYGMPLEILSQKGPWAKVRMFYRCEGYSLKENFQSMPISFSFPIAIVKTPFLDVLSAPKIDSQILQTVPRGGRFYKFGQSPLPGWEKVGLMDGREGYAIASSMIEAWPDYREKPEPDVRDRIIDSAMLYLGAQYRWGGKTHEGIDCSGLASNSYLMAGSIIYRDADIVSGYDMHEINFGDIKRGDLIFYPGHVVIYLGEDKYIHSTANSQRAGVVINSLSQGSPDFREDLAGNYVKCGSIFD